MVTFTKIGSCVSSDIFNFMNISKYYPLYAHTGIGISTYIHKADIPVLDKDIIAENAFWRRMQKYCFSHTPLYEYLEDKKSDYFIFDLCDERLPLQVWKCGMESANIPVTWSIYRTSQNMSAVDYEKVGGIEISDWHFADRDREFYVNELRSFCDSIKKFYDEKHIIYISLRQADYILDKKKQVIPIDEMKKGGISDFNRRKRENRIIEFAETVIKEEMPNCWVVSTPPSMLADERHHFGVHPLHFHRYVYEYIARCVEMIVDSQDNDRLPEENLRKKINQNIDMRKYYLDLKLENLKCNAENIKDVDGAVGKF